MKLALLLIVCVPVFASSSLQIFINWGNETGCALLPNQTLYCWDIGHDSDRKYLDQKIPMLENVSAVSWSAQAALIDGRIYKSFTQKERTVIQEAPNFVTFHSTMWGFMCVVSKEAEPIKCHDQTGAHPALTALSQLNALMNITDIRVSQSHICVIADGDLHCSWHRSDSTLVAEDISQLALHKGQVCGVTQQNEVVCWKAGRELSRAKVPANAQSLVIAGVGSKPEQPCWISEGNFQCSQTQELNTSGVLQRAEDTERHCVLKTAGIYCYQPDEKGKWVWDALHTPFSAPGTNPNFFDAYNVSDLEWALIREANLAPEDKKNDLYELAMQFIKMPASSQGFIGEQYTSMLRRGRLLEEHAPLLGTSLFEKIAGNTNNPKLRRGQQFNGGPVHLEQTLLELVPYLYKEKAALFAALAKDLEKFLAGTRKPNDEHVTYTYQYFPVWAARHFLERAVGKALPLIEVSHPELKAATARLNHDRVVPLPWKEYLELNDDAFFQSLAHIKIIVLQRILESARPLLAQENIVTELTAVQTKLQQIAAIKEPADRLSQVNALAQDHSLLWNHFVEEDPLRFFGGLAAAILG